MSTSFRRQLRDSVSNVIAALPDFAAQSLNRRFRRPILWWLFRTYGKEVALVPVGPRGFRFRMLLDPQAYSDFITGVYELGTVRALRKYVREGDFCLDIGANLGYFSILMSHLVGPRGKVEAFEPMPGTAAVLRENIRIKSAENVSVVEAAVSDKPGNLDLLSESSQRFPKNASLVGYRMSGEVEHTSVPAITLDKYFEGLERLPNLLKIDVEGGEQGVLEGARNMLTRGGPLLIVEIHAWESERSREVLRVLSEVGYRAEIIEVRPPEALRLAMPEGQPK